MGWLVVPCHFSLYHNLTTSKGPATKRTKYLIFRQCNRTTCNSSWILSATTVKTSCFTYRERQICGSWRMRRMEIKRPLLCITAWKELARWVSGQLTSTAPVDILTGYLCAFWSFQFSGNYTGQRKRELMDFGVSSCTMT